MGKATTSPISNKKRRMMQEKHEKQAESRRFSLILKAETINYLFEDHRD